jgi:hypothetical protein
MEFSDYIIFVDESGDHSLTSINKEYPVFVLCFCIIKKESYTNDITPKIRALKNSLFGHDLDILHEHDIRKKKGPFSQLNKEKRGGLMDGLTSIISDSEITIIAVVIDKNKHYTRYVSPAHPYHLALMFGLERLYDFLKLNSQQDKQTHVIVECRGTKEDNELELEFRRICDGVNRTSKSYPFEVVMKNKLSNCEGLQLADLMARPIGLSVLRPNQPNRSFDIIKEKFFAGRHGIVKGNGLKVFP